MHLWRRQPLTCAPFGLLALPSAYSVRTDSKHQQKNLVAATWIVAVAYTAMAAWVIHERRETSLRLVMATGVVASIALACYTTGMPYFSKKE